MIYECAWVPGAIELLERNYRIKPIFVISGTPQEELRRIVKKREMDCFFSGVFGSPRHKGELISMVIAEFQLNSQKCVMVGDSIADYDGAHEAGTQFIGRVGKNLKNPFTANNTIETDLRALID